MTIDGPVGVSRIKEELMPMITERIPNIILKKTIISGFFENKRTPAGGIINNATINRIPSAFIEIAMRIAKVIFNINCSNLGFIFIE